MDKVEAWESLAHLLASFEAIAEDGAVALLKIDGERPDARFTVVLTGGKLGQDPFRMDGDSLRQLLAKAVSFYADAPRGPAA